MRKIIRHSPKSPSRRGAGEDVVTGRPFRDRFVGVLDLSTGASQKDVENDLLCKGDSVVSDLDWPFDNIAVFSVNSSSRRASGDCRASRHRSDRVFDRPRKLSASAQAFSQIVDTGFFESVEWDVEVTLASAGSSLPESTFPLLV
ncbi:hypothetical protein OAZ24_02050 [Synechococcus sp. AH-736-G21]|nr:hypothetical protein [Synechococcus sp. AH-736-G21]